MIMYGSMSRICGLVNNDRSLGVCATDHSVGQALCVHSILVSSAAVLGGVICRNFCPGNEN